MPANTATRPTIRCQVIGSPTTVGEQTRRDRVDGHGGGDPRRASPVQRQHPEDEGEGAAADAQIDAGNPLRGAEAGQTATRSVIMPIRSSAAAPAPMPTVR